MCCGTDKTGTLTRINIFLEHHLMSVKVPVLMLARLNSSSQMGARNVRWIGAILRFGEGRIAPSTKARFVKRDELPFDFVRRRVSVPVDIGHTRQMPDL